MQSWGEQREVEKVKVNPHDKCLIVESGGCRMNVRVLHQSGEVNVWLGMDYDAVPEFIIGQGDTPAVALADAVKTLEAITNNIQSRRFPDDWQQDELGTD